MATVVNDCWNQIGVRGDASCKELEHAVHCRNCRVYSNAAAGLLSHEAPADYIAHWTAQARERKGVAERASLSALIFRIGREWLAVRTGTLVEIASLRPIHSLPHRRNGVVLGLANVRGELVVCVSLRAILRVDAADAADAESSHTRAATSRLLVMQRDGARAVCPVDEVHGIERFYERDLGGVPATVAGAAERYTRATLTWSDRTVGLLDEQTLFRAINRSVA
jgi:chemotaxis-related protein WspD